MEGGGRTSFKGGQNISKYLDRGNVLYGVQFSRDRPTPMMEESKKGALRVLQQPFRTGIQVDNFLPTLRPSLTDVEYGQIDGKEGNIAKVDELFRIVLTKDDRHFEEFCAALEANGYEHRARELREKSMELVGKLIDHKL